MGTFIKRNLLDGLISHLEQKEISLIVGPRQCGKTTIMLTLKNYLEQKGKKTLFLSMDFEPDKEFFISQSKLIQKITLEIGKKEGYVFLDEIQRKENAGLFLKGIYDMNLPYKFIISGSGSVELKEKVHESLVGRKRVFYMTTLNFEEFVNYKTEYKYQNNITDFFTIEKVRTQQLLEEYLNFGGYPKVVLAESIEEKRKIINEIYQSYLEKDISYLLGIRNTDGFSNLIKIIASQIGKLTNFSELSSTLGISVPTLKNYLWYLEKTFIIQRITPYFKNIRKEITKSPVFYFYDYGLRNYILDILGENIQSFDLSFLFQNFVFHLLNASPMDSNVKIHFWRTKEKAEVDFIFESGNNLIPIEVKYKNPKDTIIERSLRSFIIKYKPVTAIVVNINFESEKKIDTTRVLFIPFWKLTKKNIKAWNTDERQLLMR
jgi:predicted AAA+ superfamily ATPase